MSRRSWADHGIDLIHPSHQLRPGAPPRLGLGLGDRIGVLREGMEADLVCLETGRAHATPIYDPFSHIVFAARAADVRHVLIRGRVVVSDWQAITVDEERVRAQATEVAARLRA